MAADILFCQVGFTQNDKPGDKKDKSEQQDQLLKKRLETRNYLRLICLSSMKFS